jgi:CRP/FNR family transcriptional regulator, cyclic AMP receptor protein
MSQHIVDSNDRAILAGSVVFQGLSATELEPVLAPSEVITRKPRDLVVREGTVGDGLYVVLEGEVEVFLPEQAAGGGHRASRIRLNRLGPGRCLGEYGVIDDQPSSASASAVTAARLWFLPKAEFRKLVERHDRVGRIVYGNLLRYLVTRLRGKDKELDMVLLDDKR